MTTAAVAGANPNPWAGYEWTKRGPDGRTHEPIHWGSRPSLGENEPARRITEKQRDAWLAAFDRHAKAARPSGRRRGSRDRAKDVPGQKALYHSPSHAARAVLAYFLDLAVATGRIYPSYGQIAAVLDMPRSLVARVLDQLEQFGWIKRERRFRESTKPREPGDPKLEQDTNWYHVQLPDAAANLLSAWRRKRGGVAQPAPDPAADAARARAGARERLARQRRGMEQNLRRLQGFLARAGNPRKINAAIAELEAAIASLLRREAALNDVVSEDAVASWALPLTSPMRGANPSSGNNLTKHPGRWRGPD